MQELASREWPQGWHPGGLGWALARGKLAEQAVLFEDEGQLLAWAGIGMDEPDYHLVQVDGGRSDVADGVVGWLREEMGTGSARFELPVGKNVVQAALERAGFGATRDGGEVIGMRRRASRDGTGVAPGYLIRSVLPNEIDARVEVHRAAWLPAALPHAALHRPPSDPGATSSFTRSAYDAVRATSLYDARLDLVVEAEDATFAACCLAWLDTATGVAEIEPMGVVPQHRGKGLAVALRHEVAARVLELGGSEVFINAGPRDEYPAPGRAYLKAGFEVFTRARVVTFPLRA